MHNWITWQQWAQQVSAYIEMQKQRIDKLEQTVTQTANGSQGLKRSRSASTSIKLNIISINLKLKS